MQTGVFAASTLALLYCLLAAPAARAVLTLGGVDDDTEQALRAFITVDELPCDSPRWWVERGYARAGDQVRTALESLGHYQAVIERSLTWGDDCWQVHFDVVPGPQVRIGDVDLVVAPPLSGERRIIELMAGLALVSDAPFTHGSYESAKERLLGVAQELGYLDAEYTRHRVTVDAQRHRADVELRLASGERYRIGAIALEQRVLRPELFARLLRIAEGEPYDARALTETSRSLLESGFFDRVLVAPHLDERAAGQVPVTVTASAGSRRSVALGAGYATDTGPRVRSDVRYRRINDRGHRAQLSLLASEVDASVRAQYRLPYGDPLHDWYFVEGRLDYEETDTFRNLTRGVGVGRTLQRAGWAETNYLDYLVENFDVGEQQGVSQLLLLGTRWARSTTLDTPRPVLGYSLSLDVRGATRALLSDNDVVQVIARAKQVLPLTERLRLLARVAAGWTWQHDFEALPPSIRFFAGGDNSVRGYGYEALGPEQDQEVVGGERLLTGSVEMDYLVRPNWSVALFGDAGSAFDVTPDFSRSLGVGLRWYSPLGPLRVDLAHPLDDRDRAVRIHISLGPDL